MPASALALTLVLLLLSVVHLERCRPSSQDMLLGFLAGNAEAFTAQNAGRWLPVVAPKFVILGNVLGLDTPQCRSPDGGRGWWLPENSAVSGGIHAKEDRIAWQGSRGLRWLLSWVCDGVDEKWVGVT